MSIIGVYEGGLEVFNKNNEKESDYDKTTNINFNVATWGELRDGKTFNNDSDTNSMDKIKLTKNQYRANYYGYLKLK